MEVVDEARSFVQAKLHDRIGTIRARNRRLKQLEEGEQRPPDPPVKAKQDLRTKQRRLSSPARLQAACPTELAGSRARSKDGPGLAHGRRRPSGRPVLAFSFKTQRPPKPALEQDGSVSSTFRLSLPLPKNTKPQLNFRLESRAAWRPSSLSARQTSKDSSTNWKQPLEVLAMHRKDTWGQTGFAGLLGSESLDLEANREDSNPDDPAYAASNLPAEGDDGSFDLLDATEESRPFMQGPYSPKASSADEDPLEEVRRLSSTQHAKWRSSFNRFRNDGEIHFDDLSRALAHCGFRDRRPRLIEDTCKQVTQFATLDREEFTSFVRLYESELLNLYRAEFAKYEDSGNIAVESLEPLLKQLGLEPRHAVLEELLLEICGCRPQRLSFQDVGAMMELLREREGFLLTELERFRKVFQDFDSDESGDMSTGELVSAMGWLGFPTGKEFLLSLYQQSDINGNGVLSFSEFVMCLRHIQDRELVSIRHFLALMTKDGKVSTLSELEAMLHGLGYFTSAAAITDALQEAGLCSKADVAILRLSEDWRGMQLDVDEVCTLLQSLRSRAGFTDAQMDELRKGFWLSVMKDEDKISTGGRLHKTLRWLGHCLTFERVQQLIYEVDPEGSQRLDFTTFVKLVRKCRDFERRAAVAAFQDADVRSLGHLDKQSTASALEQLGFDGCKLPEQPRVAGMDLNEFLLSVARLQKERLRFVRTYCDFSPAELGRLRSEFDRVDKDSSGELKRHELPRLVEVLFPDYAHSLQFRPILVRLLKEVKLDETQAITYMDFLQLVRTIREETEEHRCLVYAETVRRLEFSFREASEFLAVFLSASEEARRKLTSD
ncbi:CML12, partial [Symbiodinium pilosum]